MKYTPAQLRKVITGFLGFVLTVVAVLLQGNLISDEWLPWVVALIGLCSSYGIFAVKNEPIDEPPAPPPLP